MSGDPRRTEPIASQRSSGFRVIPPEPAEDLRQDGAAVVVRMSALAEDILQVVTLLLQSRDHGLVLEEPVAGGVAGVAVVLAAVLNEDADRLAVGLADQLRVDVPPADVGEAADQADHLAELVGALPGHGEGADRPAAGPADRPPLGVLC